MKLTPNKEIEEELYTQLSASLQEEEREGIHVSDLSMPLKAYWGKKLNLPPTRDEIGYWLTGRGHHYFLVKALTGIEDSEEASLVHGELGIHFSPDLLKLRGEFKTTRWTSLPKNEKEAKRVFESYIPQCRAYAILTGVTLWRLYVLFIVPIDLETGRKIPRLKVYDLEFSKADITKGLTQLTKTKEEFTQALESDDPSALKLCPEFACFIRRKVRLPGAKRRTEIIIPTCKYWDHCKPKGRYVEGE